MDLDIITKTGGLYLSIIYFVLVMLSIHEVKGRSQKENTGLFGDFSQHGGRGLPNSQNFCELTKYLFACQIHSEVLKHVLQMGG